MPSAIKVVNGSPEFEKRLTAKAKKLATKYVILNHAATKNEIHRFLESKLRMESVSLHPDSLEGIDNLKCGKDTWYFDTDTIYLSKFTFCGDKERAELSLGHQAPIFPSRAWGYISQRTVTLAEAAKVLKLSKPKISVLIHEGVLTAVTKKDKTVITVQSVIDCQEQMNEATINDLTVNKELINILNQTHPVNRADLHLTPVYEIVRGPLAVKVVAEDEALSLLALEKEELLRACCAGIIKPERISRQTFFSATDIKNAIENRDELFSKIINIRYLTAKEAAQMLGVTVEFMDRAVNVIPTVNDTENVGWLLFMRQDIEKWVGRTSKLVKAVYNL
jgi:hypothetical protein